MGCYEPKKKCRKEEKCCKPKWEKDCMCIEWTLPPYKKQTIYQNHGFHKLIASGFVSYDSGPSEYILVKFLLDGNKVGKEIKVYRESCVMFTYTHFDRIVVSYPRGNGTTEQENEIEEVGEGEICLYARYPLNGYKFLEV